MARRARPRLAAPSDRRFRRLVVLSVAVGSNLPDIDLLYTSFAGGSLAYILQHRGYTHTLLGGLAAATVLWLLPAPGSALEATAPRRATGQGSVPPPSAACCCNLGMDYNNSYGVHPFWPFYNGWVYGDSVYIVEPLLWLAAAPLIFVLETTVARVLVAVAVTVAVLAVVASGLVATQAAALFVALTAAMLAAGRWLQPSTSLASGIALWLGVTAVFAVAGRVAATRLEAAARADFPQSHTLDRVLTPTPADPLCWDAWLVQAQPGEEVMRQARIALAPRLIDVGRCRGVNRGAIQDAPAATPRLSVAGVQWQQQRTLPTDRIARLALTQCRARAFMQFARVPMATARGPQWDLSDLRFAGGAGGKFAQLQLTQPPTSCDFPGVPWLPPRPELLAVP